MLRRANDLIARARERIRLAAEHDPHAWPERDDDRAILVHEREAEPAALVEVPPDEPADGSSRPPVGSPAPGAPDLDGALGPGGISGPPEGGRPHRPGERARRLMTGAPSSTSADSGVPSGLRTAAACASRTSVSTRHHSSYLCWSLQTRPISGSV